MITTGGCELSELLPSLGYFGSTPVNALTLTCAAPVTGIRITVTSAVPEILNLLALDAFKNGQRIDLRPSVTSCRLSTDYFDKPETSSLLLLEGKGIHSKRENNPTWELELREPIDMDAIQILNRPDEWARRSGTIKVSIQHNHSDWCDIYDAQSAVHASEVLLEALRAARFLDTSDVTSAAELRLKIVNAIGCNLEAGTVPLNETAWDRLIQLTRIWGNQSLSTAEWNIIAARILIEKIEHRKSDVANYAYILCNKERIAALQAALNRISLPAGLGRFAITRHGIQAAKLATHRDAFMDFLRIILDRLETLGLDPFISYGTLLGARREGKFIDHDDDVDVVYLLRGQTPEERQREMETIFEHFRNEGYPVHPSSGGMNAHVFNRSAGIVVDVFPCWIEHGRLFLHMEKMTIRDIPADLVYPRSSTTLNGESMPAPGNPDGFLQERYGDTWAVSDPYFEWPWSLKDN